jgi:DNA-binding transcriptional ArsR family regulator
MPKAFDPKDRLSAMLRAVSDPVRRQILHMLREKGQCSIDKTNGMCASDVEQRLDLAQPTVSHHLRVLRQAGLIESRRVGQWMWFRRNETNLRHLSKGLRDEL